MPFIYYSDNDSMQKIVKTNCPCITQRAAVSLGKLLCVTICHMHFTLCQLSSRTCKYPPPCRYNKASRSLGSCGKFFFSEKVFLQDMGLLPWRWMQTGGQLCNYTIFTASSSVCKRRISITPVHNWLN